MHPVRRCCHLVISAHPRSWRAAHGPDAHALVDDLVEEGWSPWRILDSLGASLLLQRTHLAVAALRERPLTFLSGGMVGVALALAGMSALSAGSASPPAGHADLAAKVHHRFTCPSPPRQVITVRPASGSSLSGAGNLSSTGSMVITVPASSVTVVAPVSLPGQTFVTGPGAREAPGVAPFMQCIYAISPSALSSGVPAADAGD